MSKHETIFHKIIKKEISADIVFEDDLVLAFKDINPVADTHILVIPKKTIPSLVETEQEDKHLLGHMIIVAKEIAKEQGLNKSGYRLVINTGENACQSVFQLHIHLLGGRGFTWPPG